jgi:hypothetical protein
LAEPKQATSRKANAFILTPLHTHTQAFILGTLVSMCLQDRAKEPTKAESVQVTTLLKRNL